MSNSVNYRASRRDVFSISRGSDHSDERASKMATDKGSVKFCRKCARSKPLADFSRRAGVKDGRQPKCKACYAAYRSANADRIRTSVKAWRVAHVEQVRTTKAARYAADRDRIRSHQAVYRRHNRATIAKTNARYRASHVGQIRSCGKAYRSSHIDKARAYNRAYRAANLDRLRAYSRDYAASNAVANRQRVRVWQEQNPDQYRAAHSASLAKRRACQKGVQVSDRKAYAAFVRWSRAAASIPCYWCGNSTKPKGRNLDHVIPIARGGSDSVGNLCVSCPECNRRKGSKLPEDFSGQSELRLA